MFDENSFSTESFSSDSWLFGVVVAVRKFILLQASRVRKVLTSGSVL